jgi:hypothetical protein
MATKSFSRSALYMTIIGWSLYGAAGFLLFQNCSFTVAAFQAVGVPDPLAYGATAFIAFVESATAIFLLSPSTWGEVSRDLKEETTGAIGQFGGSSRNIAALVAAILTAGLIALVVATYVIDWKSTIEGLGLRIDAIQGQSYLVLLTAILVFGPEGSTILAFQVLRRARESQILQDEEDSRLEPARIYASELKRQRVTQARQAAKTAPAWNPQIR